MTNLRVIFLSRCPKLNTALQFWWGAMMLYSSQNIILINTAYFLDACYAKVVKRKSTWNATNGSPASQARLDVMIALFMV
jgi:hypothetical protein